MGTFITDKHELKPGLVLFRRSDVEHRNWYCRVKLPRVDKYKTVSLKTPRLEEATELAYDADADVRFRLKHEVPVFNRPFRQVAADYLELQRKRAAAGQITTERVRRAESVINTRLESYIGAVQINLIGIERWENYPFWRQENGKGRIRERVSDATVRFEMAIFKAVMNHAEKRRYITDASIFRGSLLLGKERREAFNPDEYRKLHTFARSWVKKAVGDNRLWYRNMAYQFVLIMCNTGMRPSEAKNLRWRDVIIKTDREGRRMAVLQVRGKKKNRNLVAAANVADYFDRVRALAKKTGPEDAVFTTFDGKPAKTLYSNMIYSLLEQSELLRGPEGTLRSTYSFRHTYATFRISEGVDVYILAQQMGTSVAMIEGHYGHVNPIKNADRILQGMPGWESGVAAIPVPQTGERAATEDSPEPKQKKAAPRRRKPN